LVYNDAVARPRSQRTIEIERFVLENVDRHASDLSRLTSEHFHINRQAAHRHLSILAKSGEITREGTTKNVRYKAAVKATNSASFQIGPLLEEHKVYSSFFGPELRGLQENVREICEYGATEMMNNAKDHSEGTLLQVHLQLTSTSAYLYVKDDGVGVFEKVSKMLGLPDRQQAILELAKGKVTTDSSRHSGEGIFFTSRSVDKFTMFANGLAFMAGAGGDWLVEDSAPDVGTTVILKVSRFTTRRLQDVFDKYSTDDDGFSFNKTVLPVSLAKVGEENLVSRSQAKRLLTRIDRFREIIFDFNDVISVGQAFADEIFRVFANEHPEAHLYYINASPQVEGMIKRARERRTDQAELPLDM